MFIKPSWAAHHGPPMLFRSGPPLATGGAAILARRSQRMLRRDRSMVPLVTALAVAAVALSACSPAASPRPTGQGGQAQPAAETQAPKRTRALTIGVTGTIPALSIVGGSSPVGGWVAMTEMHTDGLVTADRDVHREIGRL